MPFNIGMGIICIYGNIVFYMQGMVIEMQILWYMEDASGL